MLIKKKEINAIQYIWSRKLSFIDLKKKSNTIIRIKPSKQLTTSREINILNKRHKTNGIFSTVQRVLTFQKTHFVVM